MNLKREHPSKKRPRLEERGKTTESKLGEKTNETGRALETVSWSSTKQIGKYLHGCSLSRINCKIDLKVQLLKFD